MPPRGLAFPTCPRPLLTCRCLPPPACAGLAVAERLGAPYPFAHDPLAVQQFDTYLRLAHGPFARRAQQQQQPATAAPGGAKAD